MYATDYGFIRADNRWRRRSVAEFFVTDADPRRQYCDVPFQAKSCGRCEVQITMYDPNSRSSGLARALCACQPRSTGRPLIFTPNCRDRWHRQGGFVERTAPSSAADAIRREAVEPGVFAERRA